MTNNRNYSPIRRDYGYEHRVGSTLNAIFWIILLLGAIFFATRLGII